MKLSTLNWAVLILTVFLMGAGPAACLRRVHAQGRDPFSDGPGTPATQQKSVAGEPGYLGIKVDDRGPGDGVRIVSAVPGGPADKAGLKPGDLISAVGSATVRSVDDFASQLADLPVGATVTFQLSRDGDALSTDVVLGRRQESAQAPPQMRMGPTTSTTVVGKTAPLGMRVQPIDGELQRKLGLSGERGVHIARVTQSSAADKAGIPADAVLLAIDDHDVASPGDAAQILSTVRVGQSLKFTLNEGGREVERTVLVEPAARAASLPSPAARPSVAVEPRRARAPTPGPAAAEMFVEGADDRVQVLERRLADLEGELSRLNQTVDKFRSDIKQLRSSSNSKKAPPADATRPPEEVGPAFRVTPSAPEKRSP